MDIATAHTRRCQDKACQRCKFYRNVEKWRLKCYFLDANGASF